MFEMAVYLVATKIEIFQPKQFQSSWKSWPEPSWEWFISFSLLFEPKKSNTQMKSKQFYLSKSVNKINIGFTIVDAIH